MKWTRFSKYTGDDLGIDAQDLMNALADFFLRSGFDSQFMQFSQWNENSLDDLKQAIQHALESGELFENDRLREMMEKLSAMSPEQLDQLLDKLVEKLAQEGHINVEEAREGSEQPPGEARFEVTDKS